MARTGAKHHIEARTLLIGHDTDLLLPSLSAAMTLTYDNQTTWYSWSCFRYENQYYGGYKTIMCSFRRAAFPQNMFFFSYSEST